MTVGRQMCNKCVTTNIAQCEVINLKVSYKEYWYTGGADSSTTKLYSDNSLKSVF